MIRSNLIKLVSLIICLVMLVPAVASCNGQNEQTTSAVSPETTEITTVEDSTNESEAVSSETTEAQTSDPDTTGTETSKTETSKTETSETETSETETSETETSEPETSEPETSEPETTIPEVTTESESETMEQNNSASVGVYEKYDLDVYMSPIWEDRIVHNETVMFVGKDDKVPLLYTPEKIISVRSYDLSTEYTEGVDYALEDGKLVLLEGTRIPYCPTDTYYSVHNNKPYLSTMYNGKVTQTMFGEGDTMCRWQFAVTYKHTGEWNGPDLKSYEDRFTGFIEKLEKGEDVTVFFFGDSITTGANASSTVGVGPHTPIWPVMVTQYMAKQYGYTVKYVNSQSDPNLHQKPGGGGARQDSVYGTRGTITYINTAVGGWPAQYGITYHEAYIKSYVEKYGCDLFILAMGMNNGGSTANEVCNWLKQTVDLTVACAPETDVLLVSTMIPNPEAVRNPADEYFCNGNQPTFEAEMLILAEALNNKLGVDCAVAPMTSLSKYIHSQKRFRDTTGNNVNHPSDFVVRAYAQCIFQTVFGYQNYEQDPVELPEEPVGNVNYAAVINGIYLDGADGTSNKNDAVCIRAENTKGGYNIYHIVDAAKVYVNVGADGIEYGSDAESVWVYDYDTKKIVCGDVELVLGAPEICIHSVLVGEDTHGRVGCLRCGVKEEAERHNIVDSKIENADGSVTLLTACSICAYVEKEQTLAAGVELYLTANVVNEKANSAERINYSEIIEDDDGIYARIHGGAPVNYNHMDIYKNSTASTVTGQYLVMKYRVGENGRGQNAVRLYVGTKNVGATDETESIVLRGTGSNVEDGKWHTVIVDMSTMTNGGYVANSSDEYRAKFISLRPLYISTTTPDEESDYMDIAFMATCTSLAAAESLVDSDTYEYYTKDQVPTIMTK